MFCLVCKNYNAEMGSCGLNLLKLNKNCICYSGNFDNFGYNLYNILNREIFRVVNPQASKILFLHDQGIPTLRAVSEDKKEMKRIFKVVREVLANIKTYDYPIQIIQEDKIYPVAERYLICTSSGTPALRLDMFVYTDLAKEDKKSNDKHKKNGKKVKKHSGHTH